MEQGREAVDQRADRRRGREHWHRPAGRLAVTKLLYLALTNIEKKSERSVRDWSNVLGQFAVFFKDRLPTP